MIWISIGGHVLSSTSKLFQFCTSKYMYMYLLDSVIVQNLQMDIFTLSSMRWDWDVYCIFSVRFAMDCKGTSIWTTTKRTCFNHEFFTYFINCTFPDFFFIFFWPEKQDVHCIFFFTSDWMFWDFLNLNLFISPVIIKTMIFFFLALLILINLQDFFFFGGGC